MHFDGGVEFVSEEIIIHSDHNTYKDESVAVD